MTAVPTACFSLLRSLCGKRAWELGSLGAWELGSLGAWEKKSKVPARSEVPPQHLSAKEIKHLRFLREARTYTLIRQLANPLPRPQIPLNSR
jgi:hypothetical protein